MAVGWLLASPFSTRLLGVAVKRHFFRLATARSQSMRLELPSGCGSSVERDRGSSVRRSIRSENTSQDCSNVLRYCSTAREKAGGAFLLIRRVTPDTLVRYAI